METQFKFHVGLNVSNVEQSVKFYERLFSQKPVKVERGYAKFELDNPGLVISFIESPDRVSPGFGHMGIRVNSKEELAAKKAEVEQFLDIALEEKSTSCCYAVQDKFWVNDPDGHEWEVYHFLKDDAQMGGKKEKSLVACC
jgi:catechol 2,3-dioxygenase-like lactoylglutathione lyase family enzyme